MNLSFLSRQMLVQISYDVVDMSIPTAVLLIRRDAGLCQLLIAKLTMRRTGRMKHTGPASANE
jgi:hypothetical protein